MLDHSNEQDRLMWMSLRAHPDLKCVVVVLRFGTMTLPDNLKPEGGDKVTRMQQS